ncbi:MAG: type I 3-dehydroquinate dehydratase [Tepidisphaeraceae bacterium]
MTYLCVPIFVRGGDQARRDIATAVEAGAEMLELRMDTAEEQLDVLEGVAADLKRGGIPWIATCRPTWEGGHSTSDDLARRATLALAAHWGAAYVDLEMAAYPPDAKPPGQGRARLILSSHDFSGRPERLYNLLLEMDHFGCDVKKVAWAARSVRDNLEAFEILRRAGNPSIAICMGEAGVISRILAKKFGAFLTFASLSDDAATAPGQVTIGQMKSLYRWDKIHRTTKVYGVVAHPVGHSMSPAVHNAAFDATDFDGVYVPFLVNPGYESFKAFMESFLDFEALDLSGLSVTLPHKENALRYLREKGGRIEELAARIGAVNTIVIERENGVTRLGGMNTDYAAILRSVTTGLNCRREELRGMKVAVIGAGGTGRTAVAALAHCGAEVTIYNRTQEKAQALADEFGARCEPLENLARADAVAFINATSVGMSPHVQQSAWGNTPPNLGAGKLAFDTVYNPMKTVFLREAAATGAATIGGVEMFVNQAAGQFFAWTHLPAPVDVMRAVIVGKLGFGAA